MGRLKFFFTGDFDGISPAVCAELEKRWRALDDEGRRIEEKWLDEAVAGRRLSMLDIATKATLVITALTFSVVVAVALWLSGLKGAVIVYGFVSILLMILSAILAIATISPKWKVWRYRSKSSRLQPGAQLLERLAQALADQEQSAAVRAKGEPYARGWYSVLAKYNVKAKRDLLTHVERRALALACGAFILGIAAIPPGLLSTVSGLF